MPRGGKRPGAGRPAIPEDQRVEIDAITLRAPRTVIEKFRAYCEAKNVSHPEAFTAFVNRLKIPEKKAE